MSFTRFHDDPERIKKALEQTTRVGRYQLDVPGQGTNLPYMEDAQMRLQGWGANLTGNGFTDLESDLRGLSRKLNRDNIETNNYKNVAAPYNPVIYSGENPFIEESRATHPAWKYKDLEQTRWETPFLPPIHDIVRNPEYEISSRLLAKEEHVMRLPVVNGVNEYYMTENPVINLGNGHSATVYDNK
jgi:hypothetical protein